MNLFSRAIAGELLLSSRSSSRKYLLPLCQQQQHHPLAVQHSSLYSTTTRSSKWSPLASQKQEESFLSGVCQNQEQVPPTELASAANWPRPNEIPWQAKVANSVNLIGVVEQQVEAKPAPDGKFWAGTVISRRGESFPDSPPFWIPVVFEGDLAHVAAFHLKPKDLVHIDGYLSDDPPPLSIIQSRGTDPPPPSMPENRGVLQVMVQSINFVQGSSQVKKAFKPWSPEFDKNRSASKMRDDGGTVANSWMDLLRNPQNWRDYRENKVKGLVKINYPDFKHKDGSHALWLDNKTPREVLSKLDGLEFDVQPHLVKQAKAKGGNDFWKSLVENPNEWWDNREKKMSEKSPDFKHRDTGKPLWLSDCPVWVLPKLPPLKAKNSTTFSQTNKTVA